MHPCEGSEEFFEMIENGKVDKSFRLALKSEIQADASFADEFMGYFLRDMSRALRYGVRYSYKSMDRIVKELRLLGISRERMLHALDVKQSEIRKPKSVEDFQKCGVYSQLKYAIYETYRNYFETWRQYADDSKRTRAAKKIQNAFLEHYYSPSYKGDGPFKKGKVSWESLVKLEV